MAKLTGGYFGTRGPEMFSRFFLDSLGDSAFIDLTAGTGQFPYYLATQRRQQIGLIERCPYVGKLLEAVFLGQDDGPPNWRPPAAAGYLTGRLSQMATFTAAQAQVFDGFMQANQGNGLALHVMARAISRFFSYRNRCYCLTGPDGRPTVSYDPARIIMVAKQTYRRLDGLRLTALRSPPFDQGWRSDHFVAIGDSVKAINTIPAALISGATVYADPAWPYSREFGSQNPYRFAYEDLSSLMLQRQLKLDGVWTVDNPDLIWSDVTAWVTTAFARGAKQFILCSQDTNFPSEPEVAAWVGAGDRPWRLVKHERSTDTSSFANRKYLTYWFYLTPPPANRFTRGR